MSIKTQNNGITVVAMKERRLDENSYSLYSLSKNKLEKYIIVIDSESDGDIRMIGGTREQATGLFKRVYEIRASVDHLADIAEDYEREIEYSFGKF